MKINLTDTFTVDGVRRTNDGYVTAFAKVARTGIQVYKGHELGKPELDTVRVYRPPEEVFHADAMGSFAHRPVTLRHPSVPVTAKNWKQFSRGQTGEDVVRDGEFIRVPLVMMDAALIDAYDKDGVRELSMGYSTDIKWRTGVTDSGEAYDAVQTAIRGNHLAVVPVARGGDQLRVGDSSLNDGENCPKCGAEMHDGECASCGYTTDGAMTMKTLIIDGFSVTVADDQSGSIIQRHIDKLTSDNKTLSDSFDDFKKKKAESDVEGEKKQKEVETKDGEIAVLKKKIADSEITPAKLDQLVKDRMAVVDSAAKVLGKDFSFDGKTLPEIRKAAVETKLGDSAKNMSDAAIEGAFTAIVTDSRGDEGSRPIRDALLNRRPGNGGNASIVAYDASVKDLGEAWRGEAAK